MSLWHKISNIGVEKVRNSGASVKRLIFFNQVLFIGFFATLFQIAFVWPFIGTQSLVFLIVCAVLIILLLINSKGKFNVSKWVYLFALYTMGILSTILIGGDALYHIQALLIFASCLVLFDVKKEILQILIALTFTVFIITIGEFNIFGTPDFSEHYLTPYARIANIFSLLSIVSIFAVFILRLNNDSEKALKSALNDLIKKTEELAEAKDLSEKKVVERTEELRKHAEILTIQNEEKIVLLKEVHHRVRNNLQIIVSLINLQSSSIDDVKTKHAMREIQGRVESMSLVHKKMYETSNFKSVGLSEYLEFVIENISNIYGGSNYTSEVNIPPVVMVKMEAAIPLGLIINEVVSNFFKHVHNEEERRHFSINSEYIGDDLIIKCKDNGPGFGDGFDKDLDSLGLSLISNLTEQLDGTFKAYDDNGAVHVIRIPLTSLLG